MDNPISRAPETPLRFGPARWITACLAGGAALAVLLALTTDTAGRLLLFAAAVILTGYAIGDLVFSPRLTADADGLRIRTPLVRTQLAWAQITYVRADHRVRLGLRSTTLEVDAEETLVVFSRRSLGADPETVENLISAIAPHA